MIEKITIKGLLSFGWEETVFDLKPLNVLIGPNGSGKSNLIEIFKILQSVPKDVHTPFRKKGGSKEWIHKGKRESQIAEIDVFFKLPSQHHPLRYNIAFTLRDPHMDIEKETLESCEKKQGESKPYLFLDVQKFNVQKGRGVINTKTREERNLVRDTFDSQQSVFSQRYDPDQYPEVSLTADLFKKICIYQDWNFGSGNPLRSSQETDLNNEVLESDFSNFGLVFNRYIQDVNTKNLIMKYLRQVYEEVQYLDISVESNSVKVILQEREFTIPAVRLSDGTLRWICLLIILLNPSPPPLICIEEPELGLHPDMIAILADLLKEASEKTTLIITTHSDLLIDALSETPEAVVVVEKEDGVTKLNRLNSKELSEWMKEYSSLGNLWRSGEIGGNRW